MSAANVDLARTNGSRPGRAERPQSGRTLVGVVLQVPGLVLVALLRGYQLVISPLTPPTCRYYPSCSNYALVAVQRHGVLRGGWLALRRLGRCHPWTPGGVDDVPPARAVLPRPDDHTAQRSTD